MRRRCPCSLGGCGPPGLPPCAYARAAARPPGASGPGPLPPWHKALGGIPSRLGCQSTQTQLLCCGLFFKKPLLWAAGPAGPLCLLPCCRAGVPRPLRSPGPRRRPRPRCAAPVRLMAPSSLSLLAVAGPLPFPPASSLGPCAPLCGSVAARCRPCALASPRYAAGFLWAPLLPSGSPLRFGSARRVPPWSPPRGFGAPPARCGSPPGASGPGPPRPGAGGASAAVSFCPRALFCARVLRPLRFSSGGWGSPLRPSRPRRPRWGLRGSARPAAWGLRPPQLRCSPGVGLLSFCRASSHCSGGARVKPCGCAALALRRPLGVAARQKGVSAYEAFGCSVNHRFAEGVPWSLSRR